MSAIKEIWCMPHSHLDIGYTHPQPLIGELQKDYLDQVIDICMTTRSYPEESKFRWTLEANAVLKGWFSTASEERKEQMKALIAEGRICITALPMHTTPSCSAKGLLLLLSELEELREAFGAEIKSAVNHDVNGQPWPLGEFLLDSSVDFYLTGINTHFGGIPFERPAAFQWEQEDGRRLLSFLGEHYAMFNQLIFARGYNTEGMAEGAIAYSKRLEAMNYPHDFAFLTATNPPLYDNNCPDLELAHLVRLYNAEEHEIKIRIVTADMLREKLISLHIEQLPVHAGDWTDYWNFGCGSTARETRVSRLAKQALKKAELLESFQGKQDKHITSVKKECEEKLLLYDEHTWGAAQSVWDKDSPETYAQLLHKLTPAYAAADLSGYLLSAQMEKLCKNPHQSDEMEGLVLFNSSGTEQIAEISYPKHYEAKQRQLSAQRSKAFVPYLNATDEMVHAGLIKLAPYTWKTIDFEQLRNNQVEDSACDYIVEQDTITTPYYKIMLEGATRRILQVYNRKLKQEVLTDERGFSLFEPVRETIDKEQNEAVRGTFFRKNPGLDNLEKCEWNQNWKGNLETPNCISWEIKQEKYRIELCRTLSLSGMSELKQTIIFYTYRPAIRMEVSFTKEAIWEPEGIYFAVPLSMEEGWKCRYDTAGAIILLEEEQMGEVCRDWVTVDTGVSLSDDRFCAVLSCPDAPLIQAGDFNFGRKQKQIERKKNPLLLGWALNNYWETNFLADQSGKMEFAYELNFHKTYLPEEFIFDGQQAENPVSIGAAVKTKEKELCLLTKEGKPEIQYIYPGKQEDTILFLIKNPYEVCEQASLELPRYEICSAELVTPQEKIKQVLQTDKNKAVVSVPAKSFELLRIKIKNEMI